MLFFKLCHEKICVILEHRLNPWLIPIFVNNLCVRNVIRIGVKRLFKVSIKLKNIMITFAAPALVGWLSCVSLIAFIPSFFYYIFIYIYIYIIYIYIYIYMYRDMHLSLDWSYIEI